MSTMLLEDKEGGSCINQGSAGLLFVGLLCEGAALALEHGNRHGGHGRAVFLVRGGRHKRLRRRLGGLRQILLPIHGLPFGQRGNRHCHCPQRPGHECKVCFIKR